MKILLILCVLVVAGLATGKKIPGWLVWGERQAAGFVV